MRDLLDLYNAAYEYGLTDLKEKEIELILENGGYFITPIFEMSLNLENFEKVKKYLRTPDLKWCSENLDQDMVFDCYLVAKNKEEMDEIKEIVFGIEEEYPLFQIVIVFKEGNKTYESICEDLVFS